MGGLQNSLGARVLVGLQNTVAGQVNPKRFLCVGYAVMLQVAQNLLDLGQSLSQAPLSQGDASQAGQGLDDQAGLT